jgi:hypothetical protein
MTATTTGMTVTTTMMTDRLGGLADQEATQARFHHLGATESKLQIPLISRSQNWRFQMGQTGSGKIIDAHRSG